MLTKASTDESNKVLIKLLTDNDPLKSVHSQTQDLKLNSVVHPVAYTSGSFTESQCRWLTITKECFGGFVLIKKCSFYLQNLGLLVHSDHKPLLKIFTGYTNNEQCNTWDLKATTISRCVKVQHIKGIANILADSVSRLRAVGLYDDLDFKDNLQELGTPFEPLALVEQSTHTPIEVHNIFIKPDIENLTHNYDAQHNIPAIESEESRLSLVPPEDIPRLEQKLMSLPELTPEKITLQKNDTFCYNILHHIHYNTNENYFTDAMGILHKKIIDLNSTFSSVVVPKILIKYLLHVFHDSIGHLGATKLYHFLKRLYYFQGMWKIIHR